MKKQILITAVLFCIASVILFNACCKCKDPANPSCANYDPCYGKKKITANFKIAQNPTEVLGEIYDFGEQFYDDTTSGGAEILVADEVGADSYTWLIGAGVYNGRQMLN